MSMAHKWRLMRSRRQGFRNGSTEHCKASAIIQVKYWIDRVYHPIISWYVYGFKIMSYVILAFTLVSKFKSQVYFRNNIWCYGRLCINVSNPYGNFFLAGVTVQGQQANVLTEKAWLLPFYITYVNLLVNLRHESPHCRNWQSSIS